MVNIDKTKPILVTGATGYVAGWIVKYLLEGGYTVHAAVRNPDDKLKVAHLDKIASRTGSTLRYFRADLLKRGSFIEAMAGCELVIHTASPFIINVDNPVRDLIEPAVVGTGNVLECASATPSVRRVVLTSSIAAIFTDAIECRKAPGGVMNESIWNSTASPDYQPYYYSKTMAEKKAWEIASTQSQWDLVVINPGLVLGPMLNPMHTTSESFNILRQFGNGTLRWGVPDIGVSVVDVRDVARAHIKAGFTPAAKGRYIASGTNTSFLGMARALIPEYGDRFPIPRRALPRWLLLIFGPILNRMLTRRLILNNVNIPMRVDNSKIVRELGMEFLPLQATMEDSFGVMVDADLFRPSPTI